MKCGNARQRPNPLANARAAGYVQRPRGFTGVNDAWVCGRCGVIELDSNLAVRQHGGCVGGFALALITDRKYYRHLDKVCP